MADPQAPRNPHAPTPSGGQPVRAEVHRAEGAQYRPFVRYYKQMRVNHTYRLSVQLPRVADARPVARTATGNVRVRPVVPGAVVSPAEMELDVNNADATADFLVTPAALGRLRNARLELYHHDRLVQEMPLKMKGMRQTFTWFLLCLTILIPPLIVPVFGHDSWTRKAGQFRKKKLEEASKIAAKKSGIDLNQRQGLPPGRRGGLGGRAQAPTPTDELWTVFFGNNNARARGGNGAARRGGRGAGGQAMAGGRGRGGRGGRGNQPPERQEQPAREESSETLKVKTAGTMDGKVEQAVFDAVPASRILNPVSQFVAQRTQDAYDLVANHLFSELPFYVAVVLLVLTIGSWITHARYRVRRRGKPVALAG
jgi:hypothetical protein